MMNCANQVCIVLVVYTYIAILFCNFFAATALNVETLLNCELPQVIKTTPLLSSPTFPIPGSSEPSLCRDPMPPEAEDEGEEEPLPPPSEPVLEVQTDVIVEEKIAEDTSQAVLYYTPDEEEVEQHVDKDEVGKLEVTMENTTNYVPPFNNPVYPNSLNALDSAIGR